MRVALLIPRQRRRRERRTSFQTWKLRLRELSHNSAARQGAVAAQVGRVAQEPDVAVAVVAMTTSRVLRRLLQRRRSRRG